MVVADVRKHIENSGTAAELSFLRSSDGIEIDLLLSLGERTHAFEIKATETPTRAHLASLQKWMKLSGTREATVLCLVEEERPLGDGIRALPWWDHPTVWR
jgi:predicted AAA+ superfamily ATPase